MKLVQIGYHYCEEFELMIRFSCAFSTTGQDRLLVNVLILMLHNTFCLKEIANEQNTIIFITSSQIFSASFRSRRGFTYCCLWQRPETGF